MSLETFISILISNQRYLNVIPGDYENELERLNIMPCPFVPASQTNYLDVFSPASHTNPRIELHLGNPDEYMIFMNIDAYLKKGRCRKLITDDDFRLAIMMKTNILFFVCWYPQYFNPNDYDHRSIFDLVQVRNDTGLYLLINNLQNIALLRLRQQIQLTFTPNCNNNSMTLSGECEHNDFHIVDENENEDEDEDDKSFYKEVLDILDESSSLVEHNQYIMNTLKVHDERITDLEKNRFAGGDRARYMEIRAQSRATLDKWNFPGNVVGLFPDGCGPLDILATKQMHFKSDLFGIFVISAKPDTIEALPLGKAASECALVVMVGGWVGR